MVLIYKKKYMNFFLLNLISKSIMKVVIVHTNIINLHVKYIYLLRTLITR